MTGPVVAGHNVAMSFPPQVSLFSELNFSVPSGQMLCLGGPSGSGKSTLLGVIAGWLTPSSGTVTKTGISRFTWIPQNAYGVPRRSALDHVVLPLLASSMTRPAAEALAWEALDRFHIAGVAQQNFHSLSGGEAQRLMLARASVSDVDLILVDEPTAQLDRLSAQAVVEVLRQMVDAGRIVIVATHDPLVRANCDQNVDLGSTGWRG